MAERSRQRLQALRALTWARTLEFFREPGALFWVFGFPVLLALGLGVAFREAPPAPARVAIARGAPGAERLGQLLAEVEDVQLSVLSAEEAARGLRTGRVDVLAALSAEDAVTYRYDASRPESRVARLVVDGALQRRMGRRDVATISEDTRPVPGSRYIDFLVPGLIGMSLMGSSMWGVGFAITETRKRRLMRAYAVTPLRRWEYLLAYVMSRQAFLFLEVALLIAVGIAVFGVAVHGPVIALATVAFAGAMSFSGLAILCAARTANVEVAMGLMNLVQLPMWLLGGSFFSYERFPEAVQPLLAALPLSALNDALRAVYTDGAGLLGVLPELGIMAAWGLIPFVIALKIFRWQ